MLRRQTGGAMRMVTANAPPLRAIVRRSGRSQVNAWPAMCESKIEGHRLGRVGKRLHTNGLLRIAKGRRDSIVVSFAESQYLTPMRWGVGAVFGGVRELNEANISRQSELRFSECIFKCPTKGASDGMSVASSTALQRIGSRVRACADPLHPLKFVTSPRR